MLDNFKVVFRVVLNLAKDRGISQEKFGWDGNIETYLEFKESENNQKILKCEKDLYSFLMSLEFEVVRTIVIIMLIGRDNNSQNENIEPRIRFKKYKSKMMGEDKHGQVMYITGKGPLYKYLKDGFKILDITL